MGLLGTTLKVKAGLKGFQLAKDLLHKKENNELTTSLISKGREGFLQKDNYFQNSKATSLLSSRGLGQSALATAGLFAGGKVVFDALTGKYRTNGQGGFLGIAKNVGKSAVKGLLLFGVAKQGYQFLQKPSLSGALKLAASAGIAILGTKLLNKNQEQSQSLDQTKPKSLSGLLQSRPLQLLTSAVLGYAGAKVVTKSLSAGKLTL